MDSIRIISDGTPNGTKVYNHNGDEIRGITSVKIDVSNSCLVRAVIEFVDVEAEIIAYKKTE